MQHLSIDQVPDIAQAIREHRASTAGSWPVRSTYASKIGHPCDRYLTYHRTAWNLIPTPDAKLMGIFRRGKLIGGDIAQEAREALAKQGIEVVEQEVNVPPNTEDIGGRIDFGILIPQGKDQRPVFVPVEAKSMHGGYFDQLPPEDEQAIAWMLEHPSAYMRCYPIQILTYMHYRQIDVGLIFIRSAQTFEDRQVVIRYDAKLVQEQIIDRAKALKARVAKIEKARKPDEPAGEFLARIDNLLPDRIDFNPSICGKCDFQPWCVPDIMKAQGIALELDNEELETNCRICHEMKEARDAYETANKALNDHGKSVIGEAKPGSQKVVLTKSYGLVYKKTAKSVTKSLMAIGEITASKDGEDD